MPNGEIEPKCPLCFKTLDERERLVRFCLNEHPGNRPPRYSDPFQCTLGNLRTEIFCHRRECAGAAGVHAGTLLLHWGCEMRNPFWKPQDPAYPDFADRVVVKPEDLNVVTPASAVSVSHWEIDALRQAADVEHLSSYPEMWFPCVLLRATYVRPRGHPAGVFIKLCGARDVGKTILATMALYRGNYPAGTQLGHYLYHPPEGGGQPARRFVEALAPLYVLTRDIPHAGDLAFPTGLARLNLKVLFLGDDLGAAVAAATARPSSPADLIKTVWREWVGGLKSTRQVIEDAANAPPPFTIAFYDTAGEESQEDRAALQRLDQQADVVAVLINALDLARFQRFRARERPARGQNSVPVAVNQLPAVTNPAARRCLVVTHLDEIRDDDAQRRIASVAGGGNGQPAGERELLTEWLTHTVLTTRDQQEEDQLRGLITNPNREQVHRVFFIWTEDLGRQDKLPRTQGLLKFIRWCREGAPREAVPEAQAGVGVRARRAGA